MTYEQIIKEVKTILKKADTSKFDERLVYQFTITGEGEGKFYVEINDGKINVEPYDYNDCDAEFVTNSDTLIKILKGKQDAVMAFTLGKLKVNKSVEKALKLKDLFPDK